MDKLNLNKILNREEQKQKIINFLHNFDKNKNNLAISRGIYVHGNSGIGKTHFIKEILNEINYDIVYFDGGDVRNKSVIETITKCNTSDVNVINMFYDVRKPIAKTKKPVKTSVPKKPLKPKSGNVKVAPEATPMPVDDNIGNRIEPVKKKPVRRAKNDHRSQY